MNPFITLVTDMRQKKLWPLAALLVALLVALPIVLSKSASPVPVTPLPVPSGTPTTPNVPSVSAQVNPIQSRLTGHQHDPFAQTTGRAAKAKTASTTAKTATTKPATSSSGGSSKPAASGSSASNGSSSTTGSTTTTPAQPTPTQPVVPLTPTEPAVPAGLTATEVYDVSFSITNNNGGFNTTHGLRRLSVLPSRNEPLLVEMGVLKGGRRVLFAVSQNASVSGPGQCIPGPINCEVLAMRPGEIEQLSGSTPGGMVYAEFGITGIKKNKLASKGAATRARAVQSDAGHQMLRQLVSPVLKLFSYNSALGAIVDRRNLGIGAN